MTLSDGEVHNLKQTTLNELQDGPKPPAAIARAFNTQHRPTPITEADREHHLSETDVDAILDEMVADGFLTRLDDPEDWVQLADWDERPLRVLGVSHHLTRIDGVNQRDELWLDESIRAARYEHGIDDRELQNLTPEDDRCSYHISTSHYPVLEQYRETLKRLASETRDSNPEKARVYARLADATDIENQFDRRNREIGLRP